MRCSERRIGCLSYSFVANLFFLEKEGKKRMIELNMKKVHRNYLIFNLLALTFFKGFIFALLFDLAPLPYVSTIYTVTCWFYAKFGLGTKFCEGYSSNLMGQD